MLKRNSKPSASAEVQTPAKTTAQPQQPFSQEEIAERAYRHWLDRGRPAGSPEDDWYEAEKELQSGKATHAAGG